MMGGRVQVVFTDQGSGNPMPDDPACWHATLADAENFACQVQVAAIGLGIALEAAFYVDGLLHHEHAVPRRVTGWN